MENVIINNSVGSYPIEMENQVNRYLYYFTLMFFCELTLVFELLGKNVYIVRKYRNKKVNQVIFKTRYSKPVKLLEHYYYPICEVDRQIWYNLSPVVRFFLFAKVSNQFRFRHKWVRFYSHDFYKNSF